MIRSTSVRSGARVGEPLSPLRFGSATSTRIELPITTELDDLHTLSVLMWVLPTTLTNGRFLWDKGNGTKFWQLNGTTGSINWFVTNAGGGSQILTAAGTMSLNRWCFLAGTYASADKTPRFYRGRLRYAAQEDTTAPTVGSGAENSEAGSAHFIGNGATVNVSFQGAIAAFALFNRQLSLKEIRDWQFQPRYMAGCKVFMIPGYDGTLQKVENFGAVDVRGTITGAKAMQQLCPIPAFGPVRNRYGKAIAGGGGGFQRAWAHRSNILLGGARVA